MKFTEAEFSIIKNALFVATQQWDKDAESFGHANERMQKGFEKQAREARELMARIEEENG